VIRGLRLTFLVAAAFVIFGALAQSQNGIPANGTIHGVVVDRDGLPAKNIGLTAQPLNAPLSTVLPHTKTNDAGEYRFEHVPWWGKFTVFANDEDAGYSRILLGPDIPSVEISTAHPDAQLNLKLPPKAAFLDINLTNAKTGAVIPGMEVAVMAADKPQALLFSISCSSRKSILLPPDKDLVVHISSDGLGEWSESAGRGKPLRVASGERLALDVKLQPAR